MSIIASHLFQCYFEYSYRQQSSEQNSLSVSTLPLGLSSLVDYIYRVSHGIRVRVDSRVVFRVSSRLIRSDWGQA